MKAILESELKNVFGGAECVCAGGKDVLGMRFANGHVCSYVPGGAGSGLVGYAMNDFGRPVQRDFWNGFTEASWKGQLTNKAACIDKCCNQMGVKGYKWGAQDPTKC